MRFEYIGKTKAVLEEIDVQALKMGQVDTVPAIALTIFTKQSNTFLNKFDPSGKMRAYHYEKNGNAAKVQQTLDGVDPVTDLPQLTQNAVMTGAGIKLVEYEQTGCTLHIYRGTGHPASTITLRDGTVRKVEAKCLEGGTLHVWNVFYAANLDAETIGEIAVLKKHDIEIELTAPELISEHQADIEDEEGDDDHQGGEGGTSTPPAAAKGRRGGKLTPIKALAKSVKNDGAKA